MAWACVTLGGTQRSHAQQGPDNTEVDPTGAPPAVPAAPADVTVPPVPESAPAARSGLSLGGWRIPPVATSGALAYDFRHSRSAESRSTDHLVTGTMNGTTYLYQPWFALVSGSIGLTVGRSSISNEQQQSVQQDGSSVNRFVTGNVRVDVFPRSRFPFEVHYDVSDSRIGSGPLTTFDYRTRTFGMSQKYRPYNGAYNVSGSVERRIFDGGGSRDTIDALLADFSTRWKHNELAASGSASRAKRELTDERSLFVGLVGRHHYSPNPTLSIDTNLNWTRTDEELETFDTNVSLLQWSTVGVFQPHNKPWTLSGGVRALALSDDLTGRTSQSYGASLGGTYEVSKNLRLTANGAVNGLHSGDTTTTSTVGSVGATYQGDSIDLRGFRYDWFGGGGLTLSQSGEQDERSITAQAGHTLSRTWEAGPQSAFSVNVGQSFNVSRSEQSPEPELGGAALSSRLVVHNVAAAWSATGTDSNGYARASYSDSAEIGGSRSRFQLLNGQVSGTLQFSRNQSLSGDLTLQWTRQRNGDTFDAGLGRTIFGQPVASTSRSGEISYQHRRLFDVPRLRFTSKLRLAQDTQQQQGALALIPDRETHLWENRLDWNIGRLESQLSLRVSWVDGQRRELLMWRVQRTFGQ